MPKRAIKLAAGYKPATVKADWIVALDRRLDWDDLPRSYRLLNAVMHAFHMTLADRQEITAPLPIRRCGMAYPEALDASDPDTAVLLQRVATGFKPDRLDNPAGAVVAVVDTLGDSLDEAELEPIRQSLSPAADASPFKRSTVKWSGSWSSPS
jgi:uncharacterized protein (DUF2267 family)